MSIRSEPPDELRAAPADAEEESASEAESGSLRAPPARRRWPRSLLLVGLLVALAPLFLVLPTAHDVRLSIRDPRSLTRLEASWLDGHGGETALRRTVWSFEPGSAPAELRFELRAQRGRHRLQIASERGEIRRSQTHAVELGVFSSTMTFHVK